MYIKQWKSLVGIAVASTALLFSFSCKQKVDDAKSKDKKPLKVDAYEVAPSKLVHQISVSGSVIPSEEVELKNEVAGRITLLNLPEGKSVKAGTLLVQIFNDDLLASLAKLKSQLAIQEQIYRRQGQLLKVEGISQAEYEQTGLAVSSLKAEIDMQNALIRKTRVLAPFDGEIGLKQVSPGAVVSAGTVLATLRKTDELKVEFSVPEQYSRQVKSGLTVLFTLSGSSEHNEAAVFATEQGVSSDTRNLRVRARVKGNGTQLLSGSYAHVQLDLGENNQAILIPTQAVIPQERDKKVIVSRGGKAHFVQVKTGVRKASVIEIIEGITPGDTVITTGILFLKEGDVVKFGKVKSGAL